MGIPAFIIAAARFIGTKQGIAFAQKIIGAGVVAVEAKGAAKAIAVKGDELQQEIATGKNDLQQEIATGKNDLQQEIAAVKGDLQREIAAVKSDLKLLKFGYGPIVLALLIKIAFFS